MASSTTYLFYDIETTGLNPCFDQVLQFAAVRTDPQLNELDRTSKQIKLLPEVLPAVEALLTHELGVSTWQTGDRELDVIRDIHALFNEPGTLSGGYNTLGFDDEFMRFSFYRNLLPPYTHQYANRCGRIDIYPMALLYYLFSSQTDLIKWPKKNTGEVSLKLEHLAEKNGWSTGRAHDAMVDVEATLALARAMRREPKLWSYGLGFFDKAKDKQRLSALPTLGAGFPSSCQLALAVEGRIGRRDSFCAPVLGLGVHQTYRNQTLWLRLDQTNLFPCLAEGNFDPLWVMRKRASEPPFLLPLRERYVQKLFTPSRRRWLNEVLKSLPTYQSEILACSRYFRQWCYPDVPDIDANAALYQEGFPDSKLMQFMTDFHQQEPAQQAALLPQFKWPTYQELARRLIGHYAIDALDTQDREKYMAYQKAARFGQEEKPMMDYRGRVKPTQLEVLQHIEVTLSQSDLTDKARELLLEYQYYLKEFSLRTGIVS